MDEDGWAAGALVVMITMTIGLILAMRRLCTRRGGDLRLLEDSYGLSSDCLET